jgi:hypothetical protein
MGFDQPALQWLFDVVMITGFTSLAVLCYALKQDNKKLALELAEGQQLRDEHSEITTTQSAAPGSASEQKTDSKASPLEHQDIRHFVARRSHHWSLRHAE